MENWINIPWKIASGVDNPPWSYPCSKDTLTPTKDCPRPGLSCEVLSLVLGLGGIPYEIYPLSSEASSSQALETMRVDSSVKGASTEMYPEERLDSMFVPVRRHHSFPENVLTFVIRPPEATLNTYLKSFFGFGLQVVACTLATTVLLMLLWAVVERITQPESKRRSANRMFWVGFRHFIQQIDGDEVESFYPASVKILFLSLSALSVVIWSVYHGIILINFVNRKETPVFNDLEMFAKGPLRRDESGKAEYSIRFHERAFIEHITFYSEGNEKSLAYYDILKETVQDRQFQLQTVREILEDMKTEKRTCWITDFYSYAAAAIDVEYHTLQLTRVYNAKNWLDRIQPQLIPTFIFSNRTEKDSANILKIREVINRAAVSALHDHLIKKYLDPGKKRIDFSQNGPEPLNEKHLFGAVAIMGAGLCGAFVVLLLEMLETQYLTPFWADWVTRPSKTDLVRCYECGEMVSKDSDMYMCANCRMI